MLRRFVLAALALACALAGPMPGTVTSSSREAVLRLTADCEGSAAAAQQSASAARTKRRSMA